MADTITLLPMGCVEEHGVLPVETDTIIAQAFCQLAAARIDAVVEPPIGEGFCPTTCVLKGTKAIGFGEVLSGVEKRIQQLITAGRKLIIIVNIHGGNDAILEAVVQNTYMREGFPLLYFNPYTAFAKELDNDFFAVRDNSFKECSLLLASLSILGARSVDGPAAREELGRDPLVERLKSVGVVGFSYQTPQQHIAWRPEASAQAGRDYLEKAADLFVSVANDFREYAERILTWKSPEDQ